MPDTLSLAGKTAIVTGSGRENGIGAAIATALARNGANVALHYVSEGSKARAKAVADSLAQEFGVKTTITSGDIAQQANAKRIVEQALQGLASDHIDILVNNSGAGSAQPLLETSPDTLDQAFGVNVNGPLYLTQAVVREGKMPRGGRIVNIGTINSKLGPAELAVYSASKAAQDSLTASLAAVLGKDYGITVNTIAPGAVMTDAATPFLTNPDGTPNAAVAGLIGITRAEARVGRPEDVADAVLLVVQERSRWITAQYISVSGGVTGTM